MVRIIPAMSPTDAMSEWEAEEFLRANKSPLKLGTVDKFGDPIIHPLWYVYDQGMFYMVTATDSKKLQNVRKKSKVYFCVDTDTRPYKGVKGKGTLKTIENTAKAIKMGEKIITKYLGGVENPLGKFLLPRLKSGKESLLEITPLYFSVWDDSKSP
jgi:nitroimidazol reductase NimA-like FMN-containing flavoprotein (pyridoxamine 5'-phosphate oxidase superfamily)